MLPSDWPGELPGNLSPQAARDLRDILRRSVRTWRLDTARRTRDRLLRRCQDIEIGLAVGHRRADVQPKSPTLFFVERPWVLAYDPTTRQVLRILHGARDFPAALGCRTDTA